MRWTHVSFEGLHRREDSDALRRLAALPSPSRFAPPASLYQASPAVRFATPVMRGGQFRNPLASQCTRVDNESFATKIPCHVHDPRLAFGGHSLRLSDGYPWAWGSLGGLSCASQHGCCTRVSGERSTLALPARHVEAERGHERLDLNGKGALCRVAERLLRRLDRGFHVDRWRIQPHSAETAADHVDGL